jgi:hypothetical protein
VQAARRLLTGVDQPRPFQDQLGETEDGKWSVYGPPGPTGRFVDIDASGQARALMARLRMAAMILGSARDQPWHRPPHQ